MLIKKKTRQVSSGRLNCTVSVSLHVFLVSYGERQAGEEGLSPGSPAERPQVSVQRCKAAAVPSAVCLFSSEAQSPRPAGLLAAAKGITEGRARLPRSSRIGIWCETRCLWHNRAILKSGVCLRVTSLACAHWQNE